MASPDTTPNGLRAVDNLIVHPQPGLGASLLDDGAVRVSVHGVDGTGQVVVPERHVPALARWFASLLGKEPAPAPPDQQSYPRQCPHM